MWLSNKNYMWRGTAGTDSWVNQKIYGVTRAFTPTLADHVAQNIQFGFGTLADGQLCRMNWQGSLFGRLFLKTDVINTKAVDCTVGQSDPIVLMAMAYGLIKMAPKSRIGMDDFTFNDLMYGVLKELPVIRALPDLMLQALNLDERAIYSSFIVEKIVAEQRDIVGRILALVSNTIGPHLVPLTNHMFQTLYSDRFKFWETDWDGRTVQVSRSNMAQVQHLIQTQLYPKEFVYSIPIKGKTRFANSIYRTFIWEYTDDNGSIDERWCYTQDYLQYTTSKNPSVAKENSITTWLDQLTQDEQHCVPQNLSYASYWMVFAFNSSFNDWNPGNYFQHFNIVPNRYLMPFWVFRNPGDSVPFSARLNFLGLNNQLTTRINENVYFNQKNVIHYTQSVNRQTVSVQFDEYVQQDVPKMFKKTLGQFFRS